jgi:hypothetical protein
VRTPAEWILVSIAVITIGSGLIQMVASDAALSIMGFGAAPENVYLFRLVSLLTALFGGALFHTAWTRRCEPTVLLWSGLQKVFGALAVLLAVLGGIIQGNTLLVAGYDFLAGLYVLWFWRRS